MVQFPACTSLVDANVLLDTNVNTWGHCLTQSVGMGDPTIIGLIVLIGFALMLLMGRMNLAVSASVIFGLSAIFYIINPVPFWLLFTAGIAIVSIILIIKGISNNAK